MELYRLLEATETRLSGVDIPQAYRTRILREQQKALGKDIQPALLRGLLNVFVVFAVLFSSAPGPGLWIWLSAMILIRIPRTWTSAWTNHKPDKPAALCERGHERLIFEAVLLAALWAAIPVFFLPGANSTQVIIIVAVGGWMMSNLAHSLSSVPRPACAFILVLSTGFLIGFVRSNYYAENLGLIFLLVGFATMVIRANYKGYGDHLRAWFHEFELEEQAAAMALQAQEMEDQTEVISVLLKDFEASISDYLWQTDASGRFIGVSEPLARLCGVSVDVLGTWTIENLFDVSDETTQDELAWLTNLVGHELSFVDRLACHRINGEDQWWKITGKPTLQNGVYMGYRGVITDITEARKADARIAYLAHYDELTDLPNRALFHETLEQVFSRQQDHDEAFAVITLDLDFFKSVNDVHGHHVGDTLLRRAADIMKHCLAGDGFTSRTGGDEFAIILTEIPSRQRIIELCNRIVRAFESAVKVDDFELKISASVGVAFCPEDAITIEELLKYSDLALYRAKSDGRGRVCCFEAEMDVAVQMRRKLEVDIRAALHNGELELHYQPLVDSQTHEARSFEALIRWQHPEQGTIYPDRFIGVTEQTGLIGAIGDWVIRTALAEAVRWETSAKVSINLSPSQFKRGGLLNTVAHALAATGIDPKRVEFEITECVLLDETDESIANLKSLKALGVNIALDDFGTGYSSLSYLGTFPFDKIKIDKSFVHAMGTNKESQAIVKAILGLACDLGMSSTAEGVETHEQAAELTRNGCDELQGFLFSHPRSADDLVDAGLLRRVVETPSPAQTLQFPSAKIATG